MLVASAGCASGAGPGGFAARAAAGTEAYVCTFASESQPGLTVTPVDLVSRSVDPRIPTGSLPSSVAATPDGRLLLVTNQGSNTVAVVDTASGSVVTKIGTGLEPDAVAVSPDGAWALVADLGDDTVTPIALRTFRPGPPIRVGHGPDAVAIGGPRGRTALVANGAEGTVTAVDLSSMTADRAVPVGHDPVAVAVVPGTSTGVVADFADGTVRSVQLATQAVGAPIAVGPGPTGVAVARHRGGAPGAWSAWVSVGSSLVGIDLDSMAVFVSRSVHHPAEALALDRSAATAWVAGHDGTVTPVDLTSGRAGPSIAVGGRPSALVVPPPRR